MSKLDNIKKGVDEIREILHLTAEPAHFSTRDLVDAFFGALFLGMTFVIKGLLISVISVLDKIHIISIIVSALLIITAELYFIGYTNVKEKKKRKFGQFWLKRIIAFYSIAIMTSVFLVYLFGLNLLPGVGGEGFNVLKLVVVISFPCAIGASITDLLKKY